MRGHAPCEGSAAKREREPIERWHNPFVMCSMQWIGAAYVKLKDKSRTWGKECRQKKEVGIDKGNKTAGLGTSARTPTTERPPPCRPVKECVSIHAHMHVVRL